MGTRLEACSEHVASGLPDTCNVVTVTRRTASPALCAANRGHALPARFLR